MVIGERLRNRRVELNLSRSELAGRIHVTPSAIANYENGISYPKPDILIALIIELHVDANYLYQDYLPEMRHHTGSFEALKPEEEEALSKYKELSESGKRMVQLIINEEYARMVQQKWVSLPCYQPGIRKLHVGFLLQSNAWTIKMKEKNVPEGTDFCFQIQIDRYQPVFKKYDVLALQKHPVSHNEIGMFRVNEIYYIRILIQEGDRCTLRALNVIEPDLDISPEDHFECIGRVLGKVYGKYELME